MRWFSATHQGQNWSTGRWTYLIFPKQIDRKAKVFGAELGARPWHGDVRRRLIKVESWLCGGLFPPHSELGFTRMGWRNCVYHHTLPTHPHSSIEYQEGVLKGKEPRFLWYRVNFQASVDRSQSSSMCSIQHLRIQLSRLYWVQFGLLITISSRWATQGYMLKGCSECLPVTWDFKLPMGSITPISASKIKIYFNCSSSRNSYKRWSVPVAGEKTRQLWPIFATRG